MNQGFKSSSNLPMKARMLLHDLNADRVKYTESEHRSVSHLGNFPHKYWTQKIDFFFLLNES